MTVIKLKRFYGLNSKKARKLYNNRRLLSKQKIHSGQIFFLGYFFEQDVYQISLDFSPGRLFKTGCLLEYETMNARKTNLDILQFPLATEILA